MPTTIQLSRTIWVLLTVILGGASYFFGPVVGTFVAVWLDVLISGVTERYNLVTRGDFPADCPVLTYRNSLVWFEQIRKRQKI